MSSYSLFLADAEGDWTPVLALATDKTYKVGRSSQCDVVVSDPHCSKVHASINFRNDSWYIRDAETRNGTLVNSTRIDGERRLDPEDTISIGSQTHILFATSDRSFEKGSISMLLEQLKCGSLEEQYQAQLDLFQFYYQRLCGFARRKSVDLNGVVEDEQDAVNSAMGSFFGAIEEERLPSLNNRNDLWSIMATMTARKVHRQRERQMALKRGAGRRQVELMDSTATNRTEVSADLELDETIGQIRSELDAELESIFDLRRAGHTNEEIADKLGCSERTVQRKLIRIYEICLNLMKND